MSTVILSRAFHSGEWLANSTYASLQLDVVFEYFYIAVASVTSWIFIPFWIAFVLPVFVVLLLYLSAIFVHIYGHVHGLKNDYSSNVWDVARYVLSVFWYRYGRLWHGYEVQGLENIPKEGRALLVYYHGALPIDHYYLLATCILKLNRVIRAVGDRFLFRIPGWELLLNVLQVAPGSIDSCAQSLKEDHLVSIAPGGVFEAQFGDEMYRLLWGKRMGFAKVAIEGQAPIIPVYTQNVREAFRAVSIGRSWMQKLYLRCRLPIVPIYGGFPVKLRTFIGKPIPFDPTLTPEEVTAKAAAAISELIGQHQRLPGSIIHGLIDRVYERPIRKLQHQQ